MPSAVDILSVIGRVRWAMPRNAEAMFLCDCLERLILNIGALKAEASTQAATMQKNVGRRPQPFFGTNFLSINGRLLRRPRKHLGYG